MGNFNGQNALWGCEEVNNRGKQLEDLILKKKYFSWKIGLNIAKDKARRDIIYDTVTQHLEEITTPRGYICVE